MHTMIKKQYSIFAVIVAVSMAISAVPRRVGARALSQEEILQICRTLTAEPRDTWIPYGMIYAQHTAYTAKDACVEDSTVTVKYDGQRFWWHIQQDRVTGTEESLPPSIRAKYAQNTDRTFVWDGNRYYQCFNDQRQAVVHDSADASPAVTGPLTAGIVPWGHGVFSMPMIEVMQLAGSIETIDGNDIVFLTFVNNESLTIDLTLDTTKDNAVLESTFSLPNGSTIRRQYSGYQMTTDGRWVPGMIVIDKFAPNGSTIIAHDTWTFDSVVVTMPALSAFNANYPQDTLIQFRIPDSQETVSGRYYDNGPDVDALYQMKLQMRSQILQQPRNCATAAVEYIFSKINRTVSSETLNAIVDAKNQTALADLKAVFDANGLYTAVITTDLAGVEKLQNCYKILHLPGTQHYVVLEYTEGQTAWLIDLSAGRFYERIDTALLEKIWADGVALLISTGLIDTGLAAMVPAEQLQTIVGGATDDFKCDQLIQEYDIAHCSFPLGGICGGTYRQWNTLYGCRCDEGSSNYCSGTKMVSSGECDCINDPLDPTVCIGTGDWRSTYIRACK